MTTPLDGVCIIWTQAAVVSLKPMVCACTGYMQMRDAALLLDAERICDVMLPDGFTLVSDSISVAQDESSLCGGVVVQLRLTAVHVVLYGLLDSHIWDLRTGRVLSIYEHNWPFKPAETSEAVVAEVDDDGSNPCITAMVMVWDALTPHARYLIPEHACGRTDLHTKLRCDALRHQLEDAGIQTVRIPGVHPAYVHGGEATACAAPFVAGATVGSGADGGGDDDYHSADSVRPATQATNACTEWLVLFGQHGRVLRAPSTGVRMLPGLRHGLAQIGINVYGPANTAEILAWFDASQSTKVLADRHGILSMPNGGALMGLTSIRSALNAVYAALGYPELTDEELERRRAHQHTTFAKLQSAATHTPSDAHSMLKVPTTAWRLGLVENGRPCLLQDGSDNVMYVLRARTGAVLSSPRLMHGDEGTVTYDVRGVTPASMSVRFLTIHSAGDWLLHLGDDVMVACAGEAIIDLAEYRRPCDAVMLTGFSPTNGISFKHRSAVYISGACAGSDAPAHIRFTVRGTTLLEIHDHLDAPIVGWRFKCPYYGAVTYSIL